MVKAQTADDGATGVSWSPRWGGAPLVVLAIVCLVTGVWGGLARLYWSLVPATSFNVNWVSFHGPLMVSGFLGTLIGVERAAAVRRWWAYPGPVATAAGGLALVFGYPGKPGPALFVLGSGLLLGITVRLFVRHRSDFLAIMAGGAATWLVGNLLWLSGWEIHRVALWWVGFLLLTIVAERLELSRFVRQGRLEPWLFFVAVGVFLAGLVAALEYRAVGERLAGAGMLALAAWLLRYDIARRTIRQPGLPRFTAACLLSGYVWLAFAGLSLAGHGPLPKYGGAYDASLHAFFLGFTFAMIFGHAPIIFPAVLDVAMPFRRRFYVHVVLLQASLVVRVVGDIAGWPRVHGWGGLINAAALLVFLLSTAASVAEGLLQRRRSAEAA